jgi:membrane protein
VISTVAERNGKPAATPAKPSKIDQLRERYEWLDHLVRAATGYTERHGDHYAAAITFFTVLAIVPLIMVAFAVAGYVLFLRPDLLLALREAIGTNLPAGLTETVDPIIDQAIAARTTVGVIGLLFALYAGIGWMTNLREALSEQWSQRREQPNMIRRLLSDLLGLLSLGAALVVSFGITALASGFARAALELLGVENSPVAQVMLKVLAILLALVANWLIFLWVIAKLPREPVHWGAAAKAAVFGAVGFEVLKQGMTIYLEIITRSPSGAVFGSILGLLIFIYLVSRLLLFVTAWAATARENERLAEPEPPPAPPPAVIKPEVVVHRGPDGRTAAGLVGVGALVGAALGGRVRSALRPGRERSTRNHVQDE